MTQEWLNECNCPSLVHVCTCTAAIFSTRRTLRVLLQEGIFQQLATQQTTRVLWGKLQDMCYTLQHIRSLVNFSSNSQCNSSLWDMLWRGGVTRAISPATCLTTPLCYKLQKKLPCVTVPLSLWLHLHQQRKPGLRDKTVLYSHDRFAISRCGHLWINVDFALLPIKSEKLSWV